MIDRYFFGFSFESESVVLPMAFSSSVREVGAVLTTHRARRVPWVVVVVVVSRPRTRLGLIFRPLTRRSFVRLQSCTTLVVVQRASACVFQFSVIFAPREKHASTS